LTEFAEFDEGENEINETESEEGDNEINETD
jgi:hypothetical protein